MVQGVGCGVPGSPGPGGRGGTWLGEAAVRRASSLQPLLQALLRALPKEREETLQEAERWREGINHHRKHANAFK